MTPEEIQAMIEMLIQQGQPTSAGNNYNTVPAPPPVDPYLPMAMYPEMNKDGTPNVNDQLTAYGKWGSEMADPMTSGFAGASGFDPSAFRATDVWEPLKTPQRDNLRRYARSLNDWRGIVAQSLLEGDTPDQAMALVEEAIDQERVPAPQTNDAFDNPMMVVDQFANKYFEDLATEPNVDSPNVRLNETGGYELRTGSEKTEQMKEFDRLGLPYPNQEYNMDWYRGTEDGGARVADQRQQMAMLDEVVRSITDRARVKNLDGTFVDPGLNAQQRRLQAQADQYAAGGGSGPSSSGGSGSGPSGSGGGEQSFWGGFVDGLTARPLRDMSSAVSQPWIDEIGKSAKTWAGVSSDISEPWLDLAGDIVKPWAGLVNNKTVPELMAAAKMSQGNRKRALDAQSRSLQEQADRHEARKQGPAPRHSRPMGSANRMTKDDRTAVINAYGQQGQLAYQDAATQAALFAKQRQGRTPYKDAQEARSLAMMRQMGLI